MDMSEPPSSQWIPPTQSGRVQWRPTQTENPALRRLRAQAQQTLAPILTSQKTHIQPWESSSASLSTFNSPTSSSSSTAPKPRRSSISRHHRSRTRDDAQEEQFTIVVPSLIKDASERCHQQALAKKAELERKAKRRQEKERARAEGRTHRSGARSVSDPVLGSASAPDTSHVTVTAATSDSNISFGDLAPSIAMDVDDSFQLQVNTSDIVLPPPSAERMPPPPLPQQHTGIITSTPVHPPRPPLERTPSSVRMPPPPLPSHITPQAPPITVDEPMVATASTPPKAAQTPTPSPPPQYPASPVSNERPKQRIREFKQSAHTSSSTHALPPEQPQPEAVVPPAAAAPRRLHLGMSARKVKPLGASQELPTRQRGFKTPFAKPTAHAPESDSAAALPRTSQPQPQHTKVPTPPGASLLTPETTPSPKAARAQARRSHQPGYDDDADMVTDMDMSKDLASPRERERAPDADSSYGEISIDVDSLDEAMRAYD